MATKTEENTPREEQLDTALRDIRRAIKAIAGQLGEGKSIKGTPSDLVRLIELERQLRAEAEAEEIREIKFTWVEPKFEEPNSGK